MVTKKASKSLHFFSYYDTVLLLFITEDIVEIPSSTISSYKSQHEGDHSLHHQSVWEKSLAVTVILRNFLSISLNIRSTKIPAPAPQKNCYC